MTPAGIAGAMLRGPEIAQLNRSLGVQCLIASRDAGVARNLGQVLAATGVASTLKRESNIAFESLQRDRYDLVVVDCDDVGGLELLQLARRTPSNGQSVLLAIASPGNAGRDVYRGGATLVLHKPLSPQPLATSLHAVMGKMQRERRRSFRLPVEIAVTVTADGGSVQRLTAINLSEEGMGVHGAPLPTRHRVRVGFKLPGRTGAITLEGTVIWSDLHGRNGVRFEDIASPSRTMLEGWLYERILALIHENA